MATYRPLPLGLTIKPSDIDGLGLFSMMHIGADTNLGNTHVIQSTRIIRTPLGGFINHSEEPNCRLTEIEGHKYLWTIRPIEAGEELTVTYTMYDVENPNV